MNSRTRLFFLGLAVLMLLAAALALVRAGYAAYSVAFILIPAWLLGGLLVFIVRRIRKR